MILLHCQARARQLSHNCDPALFQRSIPHRHAGFEWQTLVIADACIERCWYWQMGAEQVRSWCCALLVIKDHSIGWLCVGWPEPGFYTDAHGCIVRAFAGQAAFAIENARLYAEVRELTEQLSRR